MQLQFEYFHFSIGLQEFQTTMQDLESDLKKSQTAFKDENDKREKYAVRIILSSI